MDTRNVRQPAQEVKPINTHRPCSIYDGYELTGCTGDKIPLRLVIAIIFNEDRTIALRMEDGSEQLFLDACAEALLASIKKAMEIPHIRTQFVESARPFQDGPVALTRLDRSKPVWGEYKAVPQ